MATQEKLIHIIETHVWPQLMSNDHKRIADACTLMKTLIDDIETYPPTVSWFGQLASAIINTNTYIYKVYLPYYEIIRYMYKNGWEPNIKDISYISSVLNEKQTMFLETLYDTPASITSHGMWILPKIQKGFVYIPHVNVEHDAAAITIESIKNNDNNFTFKVNYVEDGYIITKITPITHYVFMLDLSKVSLSNKKQTTLLETEIEDVIFRIKHLYDTTKCPYFKTQADSWEQWYDSVHLLKLTTKTRDKMINL